MDREIVIVTVSLGNDGAERVLTILANKLAEDHPVTIVQTKPGLYGSAFATDRAVRIKNFAYHNEKSAWRLLAEVRELRGFLKSKQRATVLAFLPQSVFVSVLARIGLKNKLVISERNDPRRCPGRGIQRTVRDISFRFADVCVFQTEAVKRMFPLSVQRKAAVIPNPVSPRMPEAYQGARRHRIAAVGRLHPQKNFALLLEAFSLFRRRYPDYVLDIYGTGELEGALKEKARALGIGGSAVFHGFVPDVPAKIRDAAMYISSSDYEGISNSILEAMALGLPTIATDCPVGGSRTLIRHGENGLLVPVGDVQALCGAMLLVAGDPALAGKLSGNAVRVRDTFGIDRIIREWEGLL